MIRHLLVEALTTQQLSAVLHEPIDRTRAQMVRMHHLGMIEPIGIRREQGDPPTRAGYFQDVLWALTVHTKEHREFEPDCGGCRTRLLYLGAAEAIDE